MTNGLLLLLLFGVATATAASASDDSWMDFEDLFLYGKDAYLANDWSKCVSYFEKAVEEYRAYNDMV